MDLAVTEGELHALLSEVAFTRQYGFRLHAIGDGECTLEVPFQELFERPGARVSGHRSSWRRRTSPCGSRS